MADQDERGPDVGSDPEEARRLAEARAEGGRFGMMPGRIDSDATLAAEKNRDAMSGGLRDDDGNPSPPGEVGTGHVGLGPPETPQKVVDERDDGG